MIALGKVPSFGLWDSRGINYFSASTEAFIRLQMLETLEVSRRRLELLRWCHPVSLRWVTACHRYRRLQHERGSSVAF